jgi:hypothetical protein
MKQPARLLFIVWPRSGWRWQPGTIGLLTDASKACWMIPTKTNYEKAEHRLRGAGQGGNRAIFKTQ